MKKSTLAKAHTLLFSALEITRATTFLLYSILVATLYAFDRFSGKNHKPEVSSEARSRGSGLVACPATFRWAGDARDDEL